MIQVAAWCRKHLYWFTMGRLYWSVFTESSLPSCRLMGVGLSSWGFKFIVTISSSVLVEIADNWSVIWILTVSVWQEYFLHRQERVMDSTLTVNHHHSRPPWVGFESLRHFSVSQLIWFPRGICLFPCWFIIKEHIDSLISVKRFMSLNVNTFTTF